jgi:hypothetical protein
MAAVPVLAAALDGCSADDLAAEHERVMGREVFAFESVFVRPDGLRTGGEHVRSWYARSGVEADEPDSLGAELALFARIWSDDGGAFVEAHLGRWAVPALVAISRQQSAVYSSIADLTLELVAAELGDTVLDDVEDPLTNPRTGLRDIASHLLVPARSGWFLSRGTLGALSRSVALPCGFGTRVQMLDTLLRAGVEHGRLSEVVAVLEGELDGWSAAYARWGAVAWRSRLERQRELLSRLSRGSGPGATPTDTPVSPAGEPDRPAAGDPRR